TAERLHEITELLATTRLAKRDAIRGLSAERADSIVGGALVIDTLVDTLGAPAIVVSGQGAREGMTYRLLNPKGGLPAPAPPRAEGGGVPAPAGVGEGPPHSLGPRSAGGGAEAAERGRSIAARLRGGRDPGGESDMAEALDGAAWLLDMGGSIVFFNRHEH